MVAEIALALVLLTGAGLLIRSAMALNGVDPGFDPRGVLAGRVSLPASRVSDTGEASQQAFERIAERSGGKRRASRRPRLVSTAPLEGGGDNGLVPEGGRSTSASAIDSDIRLVTPAYFQDDAHRLLRGRAFTRQDGARAPRVMIINETLARQAFPGQDAGRQTDRVLRGGGRGRAELQGGHRGRRRTRERADSTTSRVPSSTCRWRRRPRPHGGGSTAA